MKHHCPSRAQRCTPPASRHTCCAGPKPLESTARTADRGYFVSVGRMDPGFRVRYGQTSSSAVHVHLTFTNAISFTRPVAAHCLGARGWCLQCLGPSRIWLNKNRRKGPEAYLFHGPALSCPRQHGNDATVPLIHHLPEVAHGGLLRALHTCPPP